MLEESGNVELENMEEEVNMRAHQEFVLSLESDDPNIKASARAELYKEARRICSGKTVKKLTKQEEEAGVKQDLHCRISAEKALNHPWFNQALASEGPGLRSLADQVKQLSLSNSKRKLNRAISKILFMRRIICALRGSISGQLLMRQESSQNNRGEKDKGCSCNCSLM